MPSHKGFTDAEVAAYYRSFREPGSSLLFIDDGGQDLPNDDARHIFSGVLLDSDTYLQVMQDVEIWITKAQLEENMDIDRIHTYDLVSRNSRSAWKGVPKGVKNDFLERALTILEEHAKTIYFIIMTDSQFKEISKKMEQVTDKKPYPSHYLDYRDGSGRAIPVRWDRGKEGTGLVFLKSVFDVVDRPPDRPLAIVQEISGESDTNFKTMYQSHCNVIYDGVLFTGCTNTIGHGLQLADVASYAFNRSFKIKKREKAEQKLSYTDRLFKGFLARIDSRTQLSLVPDDTEPT